MMNILNYLSQPWPWYVSGPLIGLLVPILLIMDNKAFGVSSSLRHICAACMPANIPFFKYNWKEQSWNLLFVGGIVLGGWIAVQFFAGNDAVNINPESKAALQNMGIKDYGALLPADIFNIDRLFTIRGLIFMIFGGLLVGFGTRYADGCTSGHSIMGISTLQWPSLVATCCFMAGGFFMTWVILPYLLQF